MSSTAEPSTYQCSVTLTMSTGVRLETEAGQRLYEEIAADFGTTVEEVTDIDEYPMPGPLDDERR